MMERGGPRRWRDRLLEGAIVFMFCLGALDVAVHVWTYQKIDRAIKNSASSRVELFRRLDVANQNDDALADQLGLLGKELKLMQQQQDLMTKRQRMNWLAALEQPTRDRARQK